MFSVQELIEIAVRIEENGARFYQAAARAAVEIEAELLFAYLADEEERHRETFAALLDGAGSEAHFETYVGEHDAYLVAYADNLVFAESEAAMELAAAGGPAAVSFAMQRELESIQFYQELKKYLPETRHALLETIVAEEKDHYARLANLKKSYR
ncbi:MAG: hypothetical protein A2521_14970 [Deltaproteobacteria bacterium RIFOXYD12_FULL_57_12]|nr:MAG: hypothetical protein A2521_14970 [Deltaproteobacteria bacterium RIFOXYD12_FULL_57_12]